MPINLKLFNARPRRVAYSHLLADVFTLSATGMLATALTTSSHIPVTELLTSLPLASWSATFILFLQVALLVVFDCYSVMWRYVSIVDALRLGLALTLSGSICVVFNELITMHWINLPSLVYSPFPTTANLIVSHICGIAGLMGMRVYRRYLYEGRDQQNTLAGKKTLIYGAGLNGRLLANRFRVDPSLNAHVVGFIDDDPAKADIYINGIRVLGNYQHLSRIIEQFHVSQVVIAFPQCSGEQLKDLVLKLRPFNIKPQITTQLVPPGGTASGHDRVQVYRDIELSDLLSRPKKNLDLRSLRQFVHGKRVLVTGAGGSIGSELARQILDLEPEVLLLLDHSEYGLYEIDRELRPSTHSLRRVVPLLVDLQDEHFVQSIFHRYKPQIVFHAAAYKHVHLVEANPYSAILNNIGTTKALLDACSNSQVERFIMISTDKAVRPAGVMGSTKRICELLVTAKALETGKPYSSVRFGNVLGSSGSLIPLLTKQIKEGGPVTITHQDMTRFFMLIPEAVSLVLMAATLARPGDIHVLRMGEPVKIVDVARNLIALMGKTEEEIPIVFTGLRPGEKMFEELYIRNDELETEHPDILTLPNGDSQLSALQGDLEHLELIVQNIMRSARMSLPQALLQVQELIQSSHNFSDSRLSTQAWSEKVKADEIATTSIQ